MKRAMFVCAAAGLLLLVPRLNAQDAPGGPSLPQHKILALGEGEWDADMTMTFPGPDGKPATSRSKGSETNRLMVGKWLISDGKAEIGGVPFESHAQYGYDTKKGKYVATWIDTMSTRIDFLEGTYDEKTKTLTLDADTEEPSSGKPMKLRVETQFKDDSTRVVTEYVKREGETDFSKFLEITFTRRKK